MRKNFSIFIFAILIFCSTKCFGWADAKLRKEIITIDFTNIEKIKINYNFKHIVRGGNFEGFELGIPQEKNISWNMDETFAQIQLQESSEKNIIPLNIIQRKRDNRYLIRYKAKKITKCEIDTFLTYYIDINSSQWEINESQEAVFSWVPMMWDFSFEKIEVKIIIPTDLRQHFKIFDENHNNYSIINNEEGILLEKIRPVRWYQMKINVRFKNEILLNKLKQIHSNNGGEFSGEIEGNERLTATDRNINIISDLIFKKQLKKEYIEKNLINALYLIVIPFYLFFLGLKSLALSKKYTLIPVLGIKINSTVRWTIISLSLIIGLIIQIWFNSVVGLLIFCLGLLFTFNIKIDRASDKKPLFRELFLLTNIYVISISMLFFIFIKFIGYNNKIILLLIDSWFVVMSIILNSKKFIPKNYTNLSEKCG